MRRPSGECRLEFSSNLRSHVKVASPRTAAQPLQHSAGGKIHVELLDVEQRQLTTVSRRWKFAKKAAESAELGADFVASAPKVLLQGDFALGNQVAGYDVSPDGQHFYFLRASKAQQQQNINVVLNWAEELKRLVPGGTSH